MRRDVRRRRVEELLAPTLDDDEAAVTMGAAWYAAVRDDRGRLFAGRHYHLVALTSRRLVVWSRRARPHRRSKPRLDAPLHTVHIEHGRDRLLFQVLVHTSDGTTHVLEFRPHQRFVGQALLSVPTR